MYYSAHVTQAAVHARTHDTFTHAVSLDQSLLIAQCAPDLSWTLGQSAKCPLHFRTFDHFEKRCDVVWCRDRLGPHNWQAVIMLGRPPPSRPVVFLYFTFWHVYFSFLKFYSLIHFFNFLKSCKAHRLLSRSIVAVN